uniref:Triacylglycerol lipase n=1 Tax=Meloidogyne hapla TaxID=6305 RepID=A0A1I8B4A0_MELHA
MRAKNRIVFSQFLFKFLKVLLILLLFQLPIFNSEFNPDFRAFVHNRYGLPIVNQLERRDLGNDASTGGGPVVNEEAVVIVHGITNKITRFNGIIEKLRSQGFQVFGTTWGDAGTTPAILGGICVDTRELLGPPLTEHIDTFLSVAGTNNGALPCLVPIPVGTCNKKNGLHCESEFLSDINKLKGYEGLNIFSIFSTSDEKIGLKICSRLVSPIVGETGYIRKEGLTHDQVMDNTIETQINFIVKHRPK